jgi:hypothetical protein
MPSLTIICTAALAALALLACEGDVVDPTATTPESTTEPQGTTTTTDPTVDPPTTAGPFPGPTSDPTGDPTSDPTTGDPTTEDPTAPALCDAMEPIAEAEFPSAMATRVCTNRNACGCASPTCTVDVATGLSDMATWSKSQQLGFDADCAAALYARADAIACDDQITAIEEGCASCNVYRGARPPGQACDLNSYALYATQCASGLACGLADQVCVTTEFPTVALGEPCFAGMTIASCPADAVCDAGGSGVCVPAPAVNEPCFAGTRCAAGQFCDPNAVCRPQKTAGEPCASLLECHSLECTNNVCTSTPWICRPQWSAG